MEYNIPVVILCGGYGTRMKEETEFIPKPLVEIGGLPMLVHIMNIYCDYGYHKFILPLGYKGRMIKDFFVNYKYHNNFRLSIGGGQNNIHFLENKIKDLEIYFVETGLKTQTGSRVKMVQKYLDEFGDTFMLTYGDGLADVDIGKLINFHFSHGKAVTVTGVKAPPRYGNIHHNTGVVTSFHEKTEEASGLINGGFFVFNKKFINYIGDGSDIKLEYEPLRLAVEDGEVRVYEHNGKWACGDLLREVENLNGLYNRGEAFWIK